MLLLSRKKNDGIVINGDIRIRVVEVRGDKVRLSVEAPAHVPIHRGEVQEYLDRVRTAVTARACPTPPEPVSVEQLVQDLGAAAAELGPVAHFTSEGGIATDSPLKESRTSLRDRAEKLFNSLLRTANRETLARLNSLLARLKDF